MGCSHSCNYFDKAHNEAPLEYLSYTSCIACVVSERIVKGLLSAPFTQATFTWREKVKLAFIILPECCESPSR